MEENKKQNKIKHTLLDTHALRLAHKQGKETINHSINQSVNQTNKQTDRDEAVRERVGC